MLMMAADGGWIIADLSLRKSLRLLQRIAANPTDHLNSGGRQRIISAGYHVYSQARVSKLGKDIIEFTDAD